MQVRQAREQYVRWLLVTRDLSTHTIRAYDADEVVGLRWRDVDLHSRSVRVVGKGRRERQVFLPNDWLTGFTRAYLDARTELGVEHPYLLFNTRYAPLTTAAMRSRLRKVGREAGVRDRVTPHMLRHTAATQLIEAGVDIRYIQRLLGHASLSTTEIYTHVSDRALRRVVSKADVVGRLVQRRQLGIIGGDHDLARA